MTVAVPLACPTAYRYADPLSRSTAASSVLCVPHFSATIASKPCQVDVRTAFTTGVIGDVTGIRIVYSGPPRVVARSVSYVAVWLISVMVLTAENPADEPSPWKPVLSFFQRNSTPSLRSPYRYSRVGSAPFG